MVKSILQTLMNALDDQLFQSKEAFEERFYHYVNREGEGDVAQQFLQFLKNEIDDKSRVSQVLKVWV
jgi:N-glycosylase/DNA lyase